MKVNKHWHNRYNSFIKWRTSLPKIGYVERHHIKPKCLGGSDDAVNIATLTAREHFIAHWMLVKAYPKSQKLKYAFVCMSTHKKRRNLKSKHYEMCRIINSEAGSKRKVSPETCLKMRSLRHTEATKKKISKSQIGSKHHYFSGYYILPNSKIKFESCEAGSKFCGMSNEAFRKIYNKRIDSVVTRQAFAQNAYIQSLGDSKFIIGKTYREIGFNFESK